LKSSVAHSHRRAKLIATLIQNFPSEEQAQVWEAVFSQLLHLDHIPIYRDPHELAGELICQMPEDLREGKWSEVLKIFHLATYHFEH